MKAVIRIALLLIAIAGLALSGFNTSSTRAFEYCTTTVYQEPPPGYTYKGDIICDDLEYELWQHPINGTVRCPNW